MRTVVFDPWSMSLHFGGSLAKHKGGQETYNAAQVGKAQVGLGQGKALVGSSTEDRATVVGADKAILADPGYSDKDKAAMRLSTLGGLGATFGSARDEAANRMARTRNTAGFGATLDELARERGRETSTAEAGLESKFADTALSERDKAIASMSNLYGVDSETMAKLLTPQFQQPQKGFWSTLGDTFAARLGSGNFGGGGGGAGLGS